MIINLFMENEMDLRGVIAFAVIFCIMLYALYEIFFNKSNRNVPIKSFGCISRITGEAISPDDDHKKY